ncbi:TIGR00730 family Rossman fold protein [Peristeroidobacter agariperforans]|uniref:TIGR00730 family Rossman fold protein n=1 Tax=Peristeroidobacter agariperforans TaxID=268404 RepID=UPI00101E11F6|nr:TIGR00730 family Rossman fold protein [Peristeroidobacter agariperforans]
MSTQLSEPSPQAGSNSYQLAVEDLNFLLRDEMRAVRFALEYAKADLVLRDWRIRSTIIVFGSARVPSPEALSRLPPAVGEEQGLRQRQLRWYEAAREFGRLASLYGGALKQGGEWRDNVIATGGGSGLMDAANRGAHDVGAPSIGFNIQLPVEQHPNPYTTPELTFRFHYFAMRKMHLAMRANALAIFPGGFGTLDELFELLTLLQTGKARAVPVVLFDRGYWQKIIDFDALVDEGMVSADHCELFEFADTADEAWRSIERRRLHAHG